MKRSLYLGLLLVLALALLVGCAPSAAAVPAQAVMYHGGPQRTGVYATHSLASFGGVKWQFKTDGQVWSSPVVAGGLVYFGSDDGHLYALDSQTGREKWRFKTGDDVRSSVAVADGLVYFESYDGYLYALNAQDGQQVWRFRLASGDLLKLRPAYDDYLSSPLVADGVVYAGTVDPRHCLYALDARTGQEKWNFSPASGIDMVHSSPALFKDTLYFGGDFNNFHALDVKTGQVKWTFKTAGTLNYAPAVGDDGTVYFSSKDTYLYALDGQTGALKWKNQLAGSSWVTSSPAVAGGLVYAGTSDGHQLFAVDAKTGQTVWQATGYGYVWSSPAVAEGMVYVGGGRLNALDAKTGHKIWEFQPKGYVYSTPLVDDGVVYVGSNDGSLYALQ
jgi:outer membrane protein assembly factor BamB